MGGGCLRFVSRQEAVDRLRSGMSRMARFCASTRSAAHRTGKEGLSAVGGELLGLDVIFVRVCQPFRYFMMQRVQQAVLDGILSGSNRVKVALPPRQAGVFWGCTVHKLMEAATAARSPVRMRAHAQLSFS